MKYFKSIFFFSIYSPPGYAFWLTKTVCYISSHIEIHRRLTSFVQCHISLSRFSHQPVCDFSLVFRHPFHICFSLLNGLFQSCCPWSKADRWIVTLKLQKLFIWGEKTEIYIEFNSLVSCLNSILTMLLICVPIQNTHLLKFWFSWKCFGCATYKAGKVKRPNTIPRDTNSFCSSH